MRRPVSNQKAASFAVSRRLVLQAMAAAPLAAAMPGIVRASESADLALILLSDMHSPYAKLPQLVEKVRQIVAEQPVPVRILINGDIFERGNAVALRSEVAADLAALETLASIAPTTVNIGNHETAVLPDMSVFVREAEGRGVDVISNLIDARSGRLFAPALQRFTVGGKRMVIAGIGTDNIFTYRAPVRDTLVLPRPVEYAESLLPRLTADADGAMIMSHTGVADDKRMLSIVPQGSMVLGAHDHLLFQHEAEGLAYAHTGSWGNHITLAELTMNDEGGYATSFSTMAVEPGGEGDAPLAEMIEMLKAEHLTEEDLEVLGTPAEARDLASSIMFATEAVRQAAGTDVAFLGHTTFGTGIAAGPMTRYDFDAYIRFDGDIRIAEVTGATLASIMDRANQHLATTLDQRTGDFVYARELDIDPEATYSISTNDWTARNQESYLGTTDLAFAETDGLMLKAIVADALATL